MRQIYLRPAGLLPAPSDGDVSEALRLAGGWLGFTAIETLRRTGETPERRLTSIAGFAERDWGGATQAAAGLFGALRDPRPRLAGLAEVGWSHERDWDDFADRMAWHGRRLDALGVGYYRTTEVFWE